jgi:glycosyltransferase involved in cell wall biosynthesis
VNPDVANEMNDKSTMNKSGVHGLGKPIVQFDLTEGRYSAQEASLYAEKNDERDLARKIIQLLDDPELRTKMGRFGRNRVESELEWKYDQLFAAYDMVFALDRIRAKGNEPNSCR